LTSRARPDTGSNSANSGAGESARDEATGRKLNNKAEIRKNIIFASGRINFAIFASWFNDFEKADFESEENKQDVYGVAGEGVLNLVLENLGATA